MVMIREEKQQIHLVPPPRYIANADEQNKYLELKF